MADRGIIFSGPMVRALAGGLKTQTRRLATSPLRRVEIGDRLWVRETWTVVSCATDVVTNRFRAHERNSYTEMTEQVPLNYVGKLPKVRWPKWGPAIHMPRWASRITLTVTGVRFQELQEICDADAVAEGCCGCLGPNPDFPDEWDPTPREEFQDLWNSLHDKDGERWSDNPALVALTFTVTPSNIDRVAT